MFNRKLIVGKTIESIRIERVELAAGQSDSHVEYIRFTDGSGLTFSPILDGDGNSRGTVRPVYIPKRAHPRQCGGSDERAR